MSTKKDLAESAEMEELSGTKGLIDGKTNYRRKQSEPSGRQCCVSRVWVCLTAFFFLTTVAAAVYIVFCSLKGHRKQINTEPEVVSRFPGFFRTVEDQFDFEQAYFKAASTYRAVNGSVFDNQTCTVNCFYGENPARRKRSTAAFLSYHACCQSKTFFRSDTFMTDILGQTKKVAQFHTKKQFFKFEECSRVANFQYGQCMQNQEYVTAVTEDDTADDDDIRKYAIEWLRVPGCCKCKNVGNK